MFAEYNTCEFIYNIFFFGTALDFDAINTGRCTCGEYAINKFSNTFNLPAHIHINCARSSNIHCSFRYCESTAVHSYSMMIKIMQFIASRLVMFPMGICWGVKFMCIYADFIASSGTIEVTC